MFQVQATPVWAPPDLWSRLCVGRHQIFPPSYLDVFGPSSSSLCRLWALWVERRQISTKYQRRCSSFPPALTSSVRHGLVPGSPSRFRLRSQRLWSLSLSLSVGRRQIFPPSYLDVVGLSRSGPRVAFPSSSSLVAGYVLLLSGLRTACFTQRFQLPPRLISDVKSHCNRCGGADTTFAPH